MNDDPQPPKQLDPAAFKPPISLALADQQFTEPALAPVLLSLRFLTDHNVPDSVGNRLSDLGHDIVRLRDVMAVDTTDPIVAKAAIEDSRILISWDRDFNQQRFKSDRFAGLSRISMSGPEMHGADRIEQVFDIVEFAIRRVAGAPMTIHVGERKVQIAV